MASANLQPKTAKTVVPVWPQTVRPYAVSTVDIVSASQAATVSIPQVKINTNWPKGNMIYRRLILRLVGHMDIAVATGNAMTAASQFAAKLIKSLFFRTSNFQYLITGVDGLTLYRMLCRQLSTQLYSLDLASVAAGGSNTADQFEVVLDIPFQAPDALRPEDLGLDMVMAGNPELTINFQLPSSLVSISGSGNTLNLNDLTLYVSVEVVENPNPATSLPTHKILLDSVQMPVTGTGSEQLMTPELPYNDRIYRAILLAQRDMTSFAELADTIIGVNDADKVSFKLNNDTIWDSIDWLQEEHRQNSRYGTAVLGPGQMFLDFVRKTTHGARIGDMVDVETNIPGNLKLYMDLTKPSGNPYIVAGIDAIQSLGPKQIRPANLG